MRLAPPIAIVLLAASACGGETTAHHQRYLYEQKCASCHGISASSPTPVADAPNLLGGTYTIEQVRRAVIDGRHGMPPGLLGGTDVDQIAAYIVGQERGS